MAYYSIELCAGAGGVPCPPFSIAGKQLGSDDERDLFPEALRLVSELKPKAVMIENVRGLLDSIFDEYRRKILKGCHGLLLKWLHVFKVSPPIGYLPEVKQTNTGKLGMLFHRLSRKLQGFK